MTYNHVLCPWKLLVGHLDHLGSCRAIVWSPGALRGLMGPPRGAPRAKTGPFGVPWGPEEARYQAKVCDNHNSNPVRPIGSSWDQIWPLWCVQKLFSQLGSVWGQKGPFGPPVGTQMAPGWSNMTYNPVIYPCEVFWGHLGPFRAKSGP